MNPENGMMMTNYSECRNQDKLERQTESDEMLTRDSRILVGQGREELHPLANPSILRHLFGYLNVKSLKSVRRTCTFWKEEANPFLQNKTKITIAWNDKSDKTNIPTLGTFMKYLEFVTPEHVFFRNYTLQDWCLHSVESEMTQFWLLCGFHIQRLTLEGEPGIFGFYEESHVRNVFYHWTPNMESLNITGDVRFLHLPNYRPFDYPEKARPAKRVRYYDSDGRHESTDSEAERSDDSADYDSDQTMPKFEFQKDIQPNYKFHSLYIDYETDFIEYSYFPLPWKELFLAYPNLKYLCVRPAFQNIEELLKDLVEFNEENPEKLHNLKRLDIFSRLENGPDRVITNENFEQAMKLKFKLESLDIWSEEIKNLSLSTIEKYIVKLSPSLKRLEIGSNSPNFKIFPPLPHRKGITFPNLTFLSVQLVVMSGVDLDMDFLQNTPKLKTLRIGDECEVGDVLAEFRLFVTTITLEPIDTLRHLNVGCDILTVDFIEKIGKWFPNLSEFGAVLDDNLLWAVYRFLNNSIQKLDIKGKGVTDAGITGIEVNVSENSTDLGAHGPSSSKFNFKLLTPPAKKRKNDEEIGSAGIERMKKLQCVKMKEHYLTRNTVQLTDDSVYNGFLLLTELISLDLRYCDESISESAYQDLRNHRNIITLKTGYLIRGPVGPIRRRPLEDKKSFSMMR